VFIVISPQNPEPLYKQVTDQVKDAIASGALKAGDRLPSIREMTKELAISEITVKRAYMDLESEGFIFTRAGMGSFVAELNYSKLREEKLGEICAELKRIVLSGRRFGIRRQEIAALVAEMEEE
jgi:GntR family transcriptional regulator